MKKRYVFNFNDYNEFLFAVKDYNVYSCDEDVCIKMKNDNSSGFTTMTVSEAEELITKLQNAVDEAKQSKWYKPEEEDA